MSERCELCQANSDDVLSTKPCCLIRILARKSKTHKQAMYQLIEDREGRQAAELVREQVSEEFKRQLLGNREKEGGAQ